MGQAPGQGGTESVWPTNRGRSLTFTTEANRAVQMQRAKKLLEMYPEQKSILRGSLMKRQFISVSNSERIFEIG